MKTFLKLTLIMPLVLLGASSLCAQTTTKKKAGPTIQELQQQVIDLQQTGQELQLQIQKNQRQVIDIQGQLLACQGVAKASAPNPMKEALEAFQTFDSTVNSGANYTSYREALIPLKIKVDRLPENDSTAPMKKTLEKFVDAGSIWNIYVSTGGRGVFSVEASPILSRYGYNVKKLYSLQEVYSGMIQGGMSEARGFTLTDSDKGTSVSITSAGHRPASQQEAKSFEEVCAGLKNTDPVVFKQMNCK